mmetsp:Transcript_3984/g.8571  ORF Transcript_3984/g.8571 Transcript_3984/m.8571 type:complete len:285 (+) Transcript_3984:644-1498(+)
MNCACDPVATMGICLCTDRAVIGLRWTSMARTLRDGVRISQARISPATLPESISFWVPFPPYEVKETSTIQLVCSLKVLLCKEAAAAFLRLVVVAPATLPRPLLMLLFALAAADKATPDLGVRISNNFKEPSENPATMISGPVPRNPVLLTSSQAVVNAVMHESLSMSMVAEHFSAVMSQQRNCLEFPPDTSVPVACCHSQIKPLLLRWPASMSGIAKNEDSSVGAWLEIGPLFWTNPRQMRAEPSSQPTNNRLEDDSLIQNAEVIRDPAGFPFLKDDFWVPFS